ncbi:hypothetical protein [Novosphingobium sp.]|uniref:hypothetical protein n=1 Tax=Novosphingobium sp. TaxID=1874826 RepID=UPI0038BAD3E0
MKSAFLLAVGLLVAVPVVHAQPVAAQPVVTPYVFEQSVDFDLASKVNGRTYRIFVHIPATPPPPGGSPALYVTDGKGTFPIAAGQSAVNGLAGSPLLVVGIG